MALWIGAALFAVLLIRTAWCAEDAFIGFRVADNFLHGDGLTWNVGERVQVCTDPLFEFLLIAALALIRNDFWGAMALSFTLSLLTYFFLLRGRTVTAMIAGGAILLFSKGFLDFSMSGLENPATHCAVAAYVWVYWRKRDPFLLTFIASLAAVNRMDSVLLFIPSLVWVYYNVGRVVWKAALLGALPFLAWEAFAVFYFGFPFPNTAYSKLHTGVSVMSAVVQGMRYLRATVAWDTVTALAICAGIAVGFLRRELPLALGAVFSVFYVVWVGGDYMLSRFLTPAFVLCCAILIQHAPRKRTEVQAMVAAAVAFGILIPNPTVRAGRNFGPLAEDPWANYFGIYDVRQAWYPHTGLLRWTSDGTWPNHVWHREGLKLREEGTKFAYLKPAGLIPYFAGPGVYVLDQAALSDVLMAHAPLRTHTTAPGHHWRDPPPGYQETLRTGENHIEDKYLAEYYGHVRHIIRGGLWEPLRWSEIAMMNLGFYNHLLAQSSGYDKAP